MQIGPSNVHAQQSFLAILYAVLNFVDQFMIIITTKILQMRLK